jgi:hypothetical protein
MVAGAFRSRIPVRLRFGYGWNEAAACAGCIRSCVYDAQDVDGGGTLLMGQGARRVGEVSIQAGHASRPRRDRELAADARTPQHLWIDALAVICRLDVL